ncbi:MAG: 50S ribosomal protein L32 [Chloroflexi bacterium]|nr:50S ribosomal protein L32 [Chloroflexota bacterium]MBP7041557.1 50S ribosomal protein L32 [Chloroflexota bacterium]
MGAVPKRRISKARRDRRRAHDSIRSFHLVRCSNCGAMKRSHHMCLDCGTYRGREILPALEE